MSRYWLFAICLSFVLISVPRFFWAKKRPQNGKRAWETYVKGSVPLGIFSSVCTICSTLIGATSMIVVAQWVTSFGDSAAWYLIAPGIGLILLGLAGVEAIRNCPGVLMPEYFSHRVVKFVFSLFIIVLYTLIMGAQITGFAKIATGFNIPYFWGLILCGSVITLYVGLGGFRSVVDTDIVQFILITMAVLILFFFFGNPQKIDYKTLINPFGGEMHWQTGCLFIAMGFMMFVAQENHQRIKAAKNAQIAKMSCVISGVIVILFAILLASVGHSTVLDATDPIPLAMRHLNPICGLLVSMGLLAAALSTADSALNIATSQMSIIVMPREKLNKIVIFCFQLLCLILAITIAHFFKSISKIILLCVNIYVGIALPLVASVFLLRNERHRIVILCATTLVFLTGLLFNFSTPALPALGAGLCFIIIFRISKKCA